MWERHLYLSKQYPKISLQEERRLITKAKKGSKKEADELVLRHIGFVIFRINKRVFPSHRRRFGDELFSEAILIGFVWEIKKMLYLRIFRQSSKLMLDFSS